MRYTFFIKELKALINKKTFKKPECNLQEPTLIDFFLLCLIPVLITVSGYHSLLLQFNVI